MAGERTNRKYVAVLASVAGVILFVGNSLKPKARQQDGSSPPPIAEAELIRERLQLQRLDQRRAMENMTSYFAEAASTAAERIVAVPGVGSALIWDATGLLVAARVTPAPQRPELILPSGERVSGELVAAAPDLPIAGYRMARPSSGPLRRVKALSYEFVQSGEWLVAVARTPDGRHIFAPGNYSGTGPAPCAGLNYRELLTTIPLSRSFLGGGLFDPDGNLIAVVTQCMDQYVAIVTEDIANAVERAGSLESRVLEHFGFRASPLTEAAVAYFKANSGLLVHEVWDGSAAARAGLAVGDVVVSVGEHPVALPEDLQTLFPSDGVERRELVVRRDGREVPVALEAQPNNGQAPESPSNGLGVRLNGPKPGQLIESVEPGSPAEKAGLEAGDRILRIDGKTVTNPAILLRALNTAKSKPVFLVYKRGPRTQGTLAG